MSTIADVMTAIPFTIGKTQTIATAIGKMQEHNIRHLPVLHGGELVGIVSERDAGLIGALNDVNPEEVNVEEAMTTNPWTVSPETSLREVVGEMVEHKYGSALVLDSHGHVVGIFTTHDALKSLSAML